MDIEDLFKIEPNEPLKMDQKEFVDKSKSLLEKIYDIYHKEWQSRVLKDSEYPGESICDKCTGCGTFLENGEERDCHQDKEQGDCFTRFCDYEQVGMNLEDYLTDISELISVDEVIYTDTNEPGPLK